MLSHDLTSLARVLRKHRSRLARKVEAIRGDLAEAERSPEYRRQAEALLAYLHQVPKRAHIVELPDPAREGKMLEVTLDPKLTPQANAARLFKRAGKGDRGAVEIRARLAAAEAELASLSDLIERAGLLDRADLDVDERAGIERDLELTAKRLPPALRAELRESARPTGSGTSSGAAAGRGPTSSGASSGAAVGQGSTRSGASSEAAQGQVRGAASRRTRASAG